MTGPRMGRPRSRWEVTERYSVGAKAGFVWKSNELWLAKGGIIGWVGPTYQSERSDQIIGYHAFLFPDNPRRPAELVVDRVGEQGARGILLASAVTAYAGRLAEPPEPVS
jgi:hypothetical protein